MSFKNDKNSCHNRAYDDEPVFTLRAKDASCPTIIRAWIADRLLRAFARDEIIHPNPEYQAKLKEALECVRQSSEWWYENQDRSCSKYGDA